MAGLCWISLSTACALSSAITGVSRAAFRPTADRWKSSSARSSASSKWLA